jgi:hypothetical protein
MNRECEGYANNAKKGEGDGLDESVFRCLRSSKENGSSYLAWNSDEGVNPCYHPKRSIRRLPPHLDGHRRGGKKG